MLRTVSYTVAAACVLCVFFFFFQAEGGIRDLVRSRGLGYVYKRQLIYDFPGTSYKTDHCGICESVSGQYVTAIEGNTSNGNTGSQSNGDGVYRRK